MPITRPLAHSPPRSSSYLQRGGMHDPGEGRFKHHGDTRADGHHDHDPVQVGDEAQKIAAGDTRISVSCLHVFAHTGKTVDLWEVGQVKPPNTQG